MPSKTPCVRWQKYQSLLLPRGTSLSELPAQLLPRTWNIDAGGIAMGGHYDRVENAETANWITDEKKRRERATFTRQR
jgi:hypothetical protein